VARPAHLGDRAAKPRLQLKERNGCMLTSNSLEGICASCQGTFRDWKLAFTRSRCPAASALRCPLAAVPEPMIRCRAARASTASILVCGAEAAWGWAVVIPGLLGSGPRNSQPACAGRPLLAGIASPPLMKSLRAPVVGSNV